MFVFEATNLLKDVVCPICRKAAQIVGAGSPFRQFNAMELHEDCPNKDCKLFYETLNAHLTSFEKGQIGEPELKARLNNFRDDSIDKTDNI
jgi:hypothetical protein